jgi:hypothetical protein
VYKYVASIFIFFSSVGYCAVYSMSLRQQLQDAGRKPVAAQHYNKGDKDGSSNGRYAWILIINLNDIHDIYEL